MGLIDLKTDLKSLKYGKDTLGGGYSGQPYIQTKIPVGFNNLGANKDFILRGGINAITDSGKDVLRLGKMFSDLKSPSGLLFIAKQKILSQTAVRTQSSIGDINEGPYLASNTLAQAAVSALGLHLMKQGINPIQGRPGSIVSYSTVVKPSQPNETNRLVQFYQEKQSIKIEGNPILYTYNGGPGSTLGVGNTNIFLSPQRTGVNNPNYQPYQNFTVKSILDNKQQGGLKIDAEKSWTKSDKYLLPDTNINTPQTSSFSLLKFTGSLRPDPSSVTGSNGYFYNPVTSKGASDQYAKALPGSFVFPLTSWNALTGQKLWNNSVYNSGSTFPDSTNPANFDNGTITYSQTELATATSYKDSGKITDFRKVIRDKMINKKLRQQAIDSGQLINSPDYQDKQVGVRNQLGNPGDRKNKNYGSYTVGVIDASTKKPLGALDKINASPLGADPTQYTDLVTFNIIPLDGGDAMTFRAFLGSISDNYSADISSHKFVGRGENFYTYGGQSRKISLSWTVAALSKAELIPMYKKLSYLASNTAPIYNNGFMRGPLVQLTIGGYIHKLPGYIDGINFEIGEDTTWEIQINDAGNVDRSVSELAHIIKVSSFSFIPIPNYLPQRGAHFIDLWNGNKSLWDGVPTPVAGDVPEPPQETAAINETQAQNSGSLGNLVTVQTQAESAATTPPSFIGPFA